MRVAALKQRIREVEEQLRLVHAIIRPLSNTVTLFESERAELRSRLFIQRNKIRSKHVERCSGMDKPWFGNTEDFADWIRSRPRHKPWTEWNGIIYHTSDFLKLKLPEMPGRIEHLED